MQARTLKNQVYDDTTISHIIWLPSIRRIDYLSYTHTITFEYIRHVVVNFIFKAKDYSLGMGT